VEAAEEIRRVVRFVAAFRAAYPDLLISVDTWRAEVGRKAIGEGAALINDTWAGAVYGYGLSRVGGFHPPPPRRCHPSNRVVCHEEVLIMRKVLGGIGIGAALMFSTTLGAGPAAADAPTPAPVASPSNLTMWLRPLASLVGSGSVTICPGQAMGSFGCSCPPGICL
ncbi:dihydropteroate synthase, partial [Nocardia cyriacigeorgica]|uniref:dihydropteroate synthase n=2 Tax=Nocardia cyriacigeorgica TaxID=135487 RepID=UPI003CC7D0CF